MLSKMRKTDFVIVVILLMFMLISYFEIHSATTGKKYDGYDIRMMEYYAVGFVAFIGMTLIDYRIFVKYATYIYLFGIALLILVLFVGSTINNAEGWLKLPGGLSLQPAELFKLMLILSITFVLVKKDKVRLSFWSDVVPLGLMTFVPFAIVMVQNDLGNAMSYIVILIGLLWIGNIKFTHALIGFAIVSLLVSGGIFGYIKYHSQISTYLTDIGRAHWMERIDPWLVPEEATEKAIYHTKNAKLAIASGGMTGEGYMKGTSVQSERVPVVYSDSIFVVVAEEFGFIGSSILLLLYFILIHRMILISLEGHDRAGPYIVVGVISMLLYQIFENIGMFIGIMPLTGITLPFISYGGTSLIINMASIGLINSIRIHQDETNDDLFLLSSSYLLGK
ncbi:FtsW/RodA/SpoVE family cell cycle protein [Paenibacillus sediminis]|uniref:Rod shape determining protein RodA n=1 Tax=Paenibacillus sediminis TaxID=664909 RepID=A0ABS4H2L6_9BACL|nr:FtsW/RodA/SpoVE family cell cycle protein [Paenibacillus sediminis]MBP1936716.1 rod shape determining protein RodA [Paenibacillus sediminis]